MKTSKRFLSLALALVLCLGLLPTAAMAAGNDFIIQDGVLKGYRGADVNVVVPDGVTEIGESAFRENTKVQTVILPDSVKKLEAGAFYGCTSLTFSKGMTWLATGTVEGCKSLETLVIPANITSIDGIFGYFRNGKDDCLRLTIYGEANSAADLCAYENGVPFVVGLPQPAASNPVPASNTAYASTQSVSVDGKAVRFLYLHLFRLVSCLPLWGGEGA